MVDATRQPGTTSTLWSRLAPRTSVQLELPLDVPGDRRARMLHALRDFGTGFAPRVGSHLLMRIGMPMVAATTPAVIDALAPQHRDDIVINLVTGSAVGGLWGAGVGALLPFDGTGSRIGRVRSAGMGAAGGIVLAPAVAIVSKYVVDRVTAPIVGDRSEPEDQGDRPSAATGS